MSFLTQVATRRMVMASRSAMTQAPRSFSVAARLQKTPVEATKDTIKQVDRKVSDKIVDGIETAGTCRPTISWRRTPGSRQLLTLLFSSSHRASRPESQEHRHGR